MKRILILLVCAFAVPAFAGPREFTYVPPISLAFHVPRLVASIQAASPGSPPTVQLNWGASPTNGVSYNVYDSATSGGEKKPVLGNIAGGATMFTDTTLSFGITRFYEVTACTGCKADGTGGAESTPTNEVSVQIPVQPSPPGTLQTPLVLYP
jgi:fibronectin type 3 domain-containing protein